MKKILLFLLACEIAGMALGQSSKNVKPGSETGKWVVTPNAGIKAVLGRLNMDFPAGVDWNLWIYKQAENEVVNFFYQAQNTKSYGLAPGEYRLLLSNVPVENVPIEKGNETRLRAGYLNIVSDGIWDLYDRGKETIYTGNSKSQKIVLPIGDYWLKLGGQFYPVTIKDKETLEL